MQKFALFMLTLFIAVAITATTGLPEAFIQKVADHEAYTLMSLTCIMIVIPSCTALLMMMRELCKKGPMRLHINH